MSDGVDITIEGVDELLAKLDQLGQLNAATAQLQAAGAYLINIFKAYPPRQELTRKSVYGSAFQSDAQRRFFFAALKSGAIEVPYQRGGSGTSEDFGGAWTQEVGEDGLSVTLGNDTSYGPYVMGTNQSAYMEAVGWKKVDDIADAESDHIVDMITQGLQLDVDNACE